MTQNRKVTEQRNNDFFAKLIFLYKPYWPLFVLLVVLFAGLAWGYLRYKTPLYETTARVLIKDEKKGVEEAKTVESLDGFSSKKIIENEIEVISSPTLVDEVVRQLHLYAPVSQKQSLKNISAYDISPINVQVANADSFKTAPEIPFSFDATKKEVIIGRVRYPLNRFVNTSYGPLKFLPNTHYNTDNGDVKGLFFSLISLKTVSNNVKNSLTVGTSNKMSSIIDLSYIDEVPDRGEDILDTLLSVYNSATISDKKVLTQNTLQFIDTRLNLVKQDLMGIEQKIQQYKSRTDAVDLSTQGKMFLQNVSNNDQKLGEIDMQLAALGQVEKYVQSKNNSAGIVPATLGVTDPTLSLLVNRLYSAELDYESIKKTAGENNPVLVSVSDQIEKIRPGVLENIQSQRKSLVASKINLGQTNQAFYSSLQSMPEKERELININREQEIKNQIYNFLLQKQEETQLSVPTIVTNNRLVDKARSSDNPVSPKKKVVYLSSLLLALLSGIGIVLSKEQLGGKIMFIHEIEELTEQPIIGEITTETTRNPIVVGEGTRTFIAEQFRKIRATLNYLGISTSRKKILITSSIPGEGKSFVATNLALSLAMTGKKVALLDFDLNNPSLNNKLSISKHKGISEYLEGECTAEEIVMPTEHNKNLFLVPTGQLPLNPSELIMNGKAKDLLDHLETIFDYIVIDTSPVGPVTDAYLLSPLCDATLFIVRHGFTPKSLVSRIDTNNKINKLKNLGIIFNGVATRGFGSKNYSYGYGYGSSYGYLTDNKKKPKLLPGLHN